MTHPAVAPVILQKVRNEGPVDTDDLLAVEEPMEIRLSFGPSGNRQQRSLTVTMRTPGHDFELAAGFLYAEGVIQSRDDIQSIRYCHEAEKTAIHNIVRVTLDPECSFSWKQLERNFYASASCGICGKSSIESVQIGECPVLPPSSPMVEGTLIKSLPDKLLTRQAVFACTGGLHAAGLFSPSGELLLMREDVGRHNALDKLSGAILYDDDLRPESSILLLSGRVGFELIQKTLRTGIPIIAAIGAPSSLAVELAREAGITLMGFVRRESFNMYSGKERLI